MGKYLAGRKTYLFAALLCVLAVVLVFVHRLSPETAFAIALFAVGGFGATFRAVLQQHHDEAMAVLAGVAATGTAVATHNYSVAAVDGEQIARELFGLAQECKQERQS